jgi:hypothetical protein
MAWGSFYDQEGSLDGGGGRARLNAVGDGWVIGLAALIGNSMWRIVDADVICMCWFCNQVCICLSLSGICRAHHL